MEQRAACLLQRDSWDAGASAGSQSLLRQSNSEVHLSAALHLVVQLIMYHTMSIQHSFDNAAVITHESGERPLKHSGLATTA